jgi:hypothetical protein
MPITFDEIKSSAITAFSAFIGVVAAMWMLFVSVGDRTWVTKAEFIPVKEDIAAIKAVIGSGHGDIMARRCRANASQNVNSDKEGE